MNERDRHSITDLTSGQQFWNEKGWNDDDKEGDNLEGDNLNQSLIARIKDFTTRKKWRQRRIPRAGKQKAACDFGDGGPGGRAPGGGDYDDSNHDENDSQDNAAAEKTKKMWRKPCKRVHKWFETKQDLKNIPKTIRTCFEIGQK